MIVEDDGNLRLGLKVNLEKEGYHVTEAADGAAALAALAAGEFGLVILDVMLPDMDGYAICRHIRKGGKTPMAMMLTARTLEDDLVKGFEAGADDYLEKPYRVRELLARVRALVRRGDETVEATFRFGGFTLDAASHKVTGPDGQKVDLTPKEYALLHLFLKKPGQALTRDAILDQIWGESVHVDERTVDNFVSSIKKKLNWTHDSGFSIETIRGVGYRMETDLH